MKKFLFGVLFFNILCAAYTQERPKVTIVNKTGVTVKTVYVSLTTGSDFDKNEIEGNQLENGNRVVITLEKPLKAANIYDIQLIDSKGKRYTKWEVLITPNMTVEFTGDDRQ